MLTIVALEIYISIDKEDSFHIKGAEFSNFNYLVELDKKLKMKDAPLHVKGDVNVYIHRLSKGKGFILAYRWFSSGDTMIIDDEVFEKLTIWLKDLPASFPINYDFTTTNNIKAAYTSGGSAWPKHNCSGYIESGKMTLDKFGDSYSVKISGTVYPAGSSYCEEKEIDLEFFTKEIKFSELTTWLGLEGEHPYDETYR